MNEHEMLASLAAVRYAEREAVRGYELTEQLTGSDELRRNLGAFREDHDRHVRALDGLLGGTEAPEPSHEQMALVQEHLRLVDEARAEDEAIRGLLLMELHASSAYAATEEAELPAEVEQVLRRNHADEQRHVSYLEMRTPIAVGSPGIRYGRPSPGVAPGDEGVGEGGSIGGAVSGAAPPRGRIEGRR